MTWLPPDSSSRAYASLAVVLGLTLAAACSSGANDDGAPASDGSTPPIGLEAGTANDSGAAPPLGADAADAADVDDFPEATRHFYVSPNGNDDHDGLSRDHAWRTLAKVNAAPLLAGDAVLLQRGGEWGEALVVGASGTADHPVMFGSYGAGAKPKLWGSDLLSNAAFTPSAGAPGIYEIAVSFAVNCVTVDHAFLLASKTPGSGTVTNGTYDLVSGKLRLGSGTDPRVDGKAYRACQREDVVSIEGRQHVRVENIVVDESAKADGGYGIRVMDSTDVELRDTEIYRAGKHHVGVINSTGFVGRGLHAAYAMPGQGAGGASAFVSFGDAAAGGQTSEWRDCSFEHPEDTANPGTSYYTFLNHGAALKSVLLDGVVSHGANISLSNEESPNATIRIHGGIIDNARLEVYGTGAVVDGVKLTGPLASVNLAGSGIVAQNLLVVGANPGSAWYQSAIASRGMNNTVRFSTIVMAPEAATYDTCLALVNAGTGFRYYANILSAPKRVMKEWAGSPSASDIADASYNLLRAGATFNDGDMSLAAWQGFGLDTTARTGEPGFTNATANDYSLLPASPAVDGAPLSADLLTTIPVDFAGSPRRKGAAFDMGAFER